MNSAGPISMTVPCPTGTYVVGGGVSASDPSVIAVATSRPSATTANGSWEIVAYTNDQYIGNFLFVTGYAVCAQ